jgi:hypothetical protein
MKLRDAGLRRSTFICRLLARNERFPATARDTGLDIERYEVRIEDGEVLVRLPARPQMPMTGNRSSF